MSTDSEQHGMKSDLALGDIPALIRFSADVTETLRLDDGIYCFDREWAEGVNRGRSLRYTLMVALGFERAARAGYPLPRSASELVDLVMASAAELTPGDRGLALWALARLGDARAPELARELAAVPDEVLRPLEGMEIAWLVIGAAAALDGGFAAPSLLERYVAVLRSRKATKGPLFGHLGGGRRAVLPNFATQIYSVLALADTARVTNDTTALDDARRLADLLVELRRDDAGWPWLFHAERSCVVEPYQVYSVHQDAMAPMAFFSLAEATGDDRYARAGAEGLPWCYGQNELGFPFYDVSGRFAHRAIRRSGWADRAALWTNTAAALAGTTRRAELGKPMLNSTCRPYHLGWILEAWAGREAHVDLIGAAS